MALRPPQRVQRMNLLAFAQVHLWLPRMGDIMWLILLSHVFHRENFPCSFSFWYREISQSPFDSKKCLQRGGHLWWEGNGGWTWTSYFMCSLGWVFGVSWRNGLQRFSWLETKLGCQNQKCCTESCRNLLLILRLCRHSCLHFACLLWITFRWYGLRTCTAGAQGRLLVAFQSAPLRVQMQERTAVHWWKANGIHLCIRAWRKKLRILYAQPLL